MKNIYYILTIAFALLTSGCSTKQSKISTTKLPESISKAKNDSERYIMTFYPLAVEQMNRHDIPASITLAQGLLESGSGKSKLAIEGKNHFGIKADSRWKGRYIKVMDNGALHKFRVYDNAADSYEDHSSFLIHNRRYAHLFKLGRKDYKGWAKGLRDAYYAEDRQYHNKLIGLIEKYGLQKFDHYSMSDIKVDLKRYAMQQQTPQRTIYKSNGLLYTKARQGDTFATLSKELGISKRKIIKYNDLYKGYKLKENDIIYLEKKNRKALKKYQSHIAKSNESLYTISQTYGIRLERLYDMNPIYKRGFELKVGDEVRLR